MQAYHNLLKHCLEHGEHQNDRTGVGTLSCFGAQIRFNLQEGFPLLTTKKLYTRAITEELLWFLRGSTNNNELAEKRVHIWDEWATESGDLGPIYGKQWRSWKGADGTLHDQITALIEGLRKRPASRRHIVSAWNVSDLPNEALSPQGNVREGRMALAPCHTLFQFYVSPSGKLSCQLYQRSADLFLGVPFNIASYALFTHMIAHVLGLEVGDYVHTFGDYHIYLNHHEQVKELLTRNHRPLPKLEITRQVPDIFSFTAEDFKIIGYNPHPAIKAPVAV